MLRSPHLVEDERGIVMMGLIPNRKGQSLLVEWQVAVMRGNQPPVLEDFDVFRQRAGLQAGQLPNPGKSLMLEPLQADLQRAVSHMQQHMGQCQQAFAATMAQRLELTLTDLKQMQERQIEELERRLERQGGLENLRRASASAVSARSVACLTNTRPGYATACRPSRIRISRSWLLWSAEETR